MDNNNKSGSNAKKSGNPRIITMDSIRGSQQEPERQAYFAGGSEHSGQQILGRGKRRNDQDPGHSHESGEALAAAFRRASSSGSGRSEPQSVSFHQGPHVFGGAGHRLGDTDLPEQDLPTVQMSPDPEDPAQVILTLWENGYNIDNGPLQTYDDPRCAELMRNIDRGELPTGLLPLERPGPVHLSVVDKRAQKYKESLKVFGGKGHKLGSPTPPMSPPQPGEERSPAREADDSIRGIDSLEVLRDGRARPHGFDDEGTVDVIFEDEDESGNSDDLDFIPNERRTDRVFGGQGHVLERSGGNQLQVNPCPKPGSSALSVESNTDFSDGSENKITLKIRLPNGNTVQIIVNASCTIERLRAHLKKCIPNLSDVNFSLHLTYPRREVRDNEVVSSPELNNSVLVLQF